MIEWNTDLHIMELAYVINSTARDSEIVWQSEGQNITWRNGCYFVRDKELEALS